MNSFKYYENTLLDGTVWFISERT